MFKQGDKIRCLEDYAGYIVKRILYEVAFNQRAGSNIVHVNTTRGAQGFFAYRFEFVKSAEPTDQELADEYRNLRVELKRVRDVLTERGYEIENRGDKTFITWVNNI